MISAGERKGPYTWSI